MDGLASEKEQVKRVEATCKRGRFLDSYVYACKNTVLSSMIPDRRLGL